MQTLDTLPWQSRFRQLGHDYHLPVQPTPLPSPTLGAWNAPLAKQLGLPSQAQKHPELCEWLAGNQSLPFSPLAALYAGHQFGVYVPQLGDGRALLLGELQGTDGQVWEIQLKGAGETPFSRRGDGRAVLRSSIREYLCAEAMAGLGIPTTRSLALVHSPEPVYRETAETAAVVTRVAPSFIRFGSFEVFFYRQQYPAIQRLADFVIDHYYPDCRKTESPYVALLEAIIERTAQLIAHWQAVGFCHGVMNSDNMSILGLTLDYGPFGFLDGYHPGHICNHSDHAGRYAFDQQPGIGLWNLHCLAQALVGLTGKDAAIAALHTYQTHFDTAYLGLMRKKLGLQSPHPDDEVLIGDLLALLAEGQTDYTLFFRELSHCAAHANRQHLRDWVVDRSGMDHWITRYQQRLALETQPPQQQHKLMLACNPKYILRNWMAEEAIRMARDHHDWQIFTAIETVLAAPFAEHPEHARFAATPPDWAQSLSVSCSS